MSLSFRKIRVSDAALLLKWRTAPDITRHMYTDLVDPSVEKQARWIESVSKQNDFIGFMILDDDSPVGYLCFNDINVVHQRCSTGSYIYDKPARLKYAATMGTYVCNYAFECLNMNKIENYILDANKKVVKLQKLQKSTVVGCLTQHVYKNGQFHDVIIFETLKQNWRQHKQHYSLEHIKQAFEGWD